MTTFYPTTDEPSLFDEGYRVRAVTSRTVGTFLVTNPQGHTYIVRPLQNRCTCPARVRCKHLKFLFGLLRDCWCEVNDDPAHEAEMYRLVCEMDAVNASGTRYAAAEVTR